MADTRSVTQFSALRLPVAVFLRSERKKSNRLFSEWEMVRDFSVVNCQFGSGGKSPNTLRLAWLTLL